ncbi:MAG: glycosyltransferase family 4 protein [Acidobacteriota bacterium]
MRNPFPHEPTILFVVPGDIQRQTGGSFYDRKLADSLTERGFRVEMVTVPDLPYFAGLVAGLAIAPRLLLLLARRKYDVVIEDGWAHPTTLLFNVACWLIGRVRLVIIVHQVRWRAVKPPVGFIVRMVERVSLRSAQLIVTVSRFISSDVERLVGSGVPVVLAPPGSAPISAATRERGETGAIPLRLLFVGNCARLKGLDHLIGALALLRDIPLTLDLVGDVNVEPRYYKKLVKQVNALGVSERVIFHGAVAHEDLGHFYSRAGIFTFPSLYEGFGIVLAEAMHAGLAIVATRTGPANEIVREGANALIVPPADSAALAGAIRRLATNTVLREDFGRRSRELAGSLPTWAQTCDTICDRIEIMSRTTRGTKRTTNSIPTR